MEQSSAVQPLSQRHDPLTHLPLNAQSLGHMIFAIWSNIVGISTSVWSVTLNVIFRTTSSLHSLIKRETAPMAKERSPVYCKTLDKNKLKNKKKIKEIDRIVDICQTINYYRIKQRDLKLANTNAAMAHPVFLKLLLSLSLPVTAFVNVITFGIQECQLVL